ncbi:MAG: excinuclease ABC subunit B, partial [Desulfobacterium sp.]|nr:excinuclease ABC subunit B [Desulfobacterium sp.]
IDETKRRRDVQNAYNLANHIIPKTIQKEITSTFLPVEAYITEKRPSDRIAETLARYGASDDLDHIISSMEKEMKSAAEELEFEKAAEIRDRIEALKKRMLFEL